MVFNPCFPAAVDQELTQRFGKGIGHGSMSHPSGLKFVIKGVNPEPGVVDELICNDYVAPADFLPEASAGGCCENILATQLFQCLDICPVVYLGRRDGMISSMA